MVPFIHVVLVCSGAVFLGEIGDKTQLLSLLLACRYRRPVPVIAGILVATLANHALAAAGGVYLHQLLDPHWLRSGLGLAFILTALWTLRPDSLNEDAQPHRSDRSVFWIATIAFFLAEIGDKTQVVTVLLAARFDALLPVVTGTTLGMLLADVPVVLLGQRLAGRLSLWWVRYCAAAAFAALGVLAVLGH